MVLLVFPLSSLFQVIQQLSLHRRPQLAQALRPGPPVARLEDQDGGELVGAAVGVVPLEVAKEGDLAPPPPAPADRHEAAGGERLGQDLAVPQELVTPAAEGAVDGERRLPL